MPLIESNEERSPVVNLILKNYLQPLIKKNIDTLILGCTHYGVLENKIREITRNKIAIVNEGKIISQKLKDYLRRHPEIEQNLCQESKIKFFTTDLTDKFKILGGIFFGKKIFPEKIELK